jgi:hypothetical protein
MLPLLLSQARPAPSLQIHRAFSWAAIVPPFYERIAHELRCKACNAILQNQSVEFIRRGVLPVDVYAYMFPDV